MNLHSGEIVVIYRVLLLILKGDHFVKFWLYIDRKLLLFFTLMQELEFQDFYFRHVSSERFTYLHNIFKDIL